MSKLALSALLLSAVLVGCAPADSEPSSAATASPVLIERPSATEAAIISRELPHKNDSRISYCEILSSDKKSYSGYRDQKLYPLASLSKLITTAWALKKLGPDHIFQSQWHLRPVPSQAGTFDAYLKTNLDPVFNIEKVLYSLSLLNDAGVLRIRNLVIDESTRIYLSALTQPHIELENVPISSSDTVRNLKLILNSSNWSSQTQGAKQRLHAWSLDNKKVLNIPSQFSVDNVELKKAASIDQAVYTKVITVSSSRLTKYLKNLNVYSNNYVSDALFSYLGGVGPFNEFQKTELKLAAKELQFYSGSGLADSSSGIRKDNLGTCVAMLKVLNYTDIIAQKNGLNLGHFLYNPALDEDGTFESNLNFKNQIVLKTGRLFENPALNVAGIASTELGSFYFTFLGHNFSDDDSSEIEEARDTMITSALDYYPTKSSFFTLKEFEVFLK